MRFFKGVLPNITISLSLIMPIILYVHWRNPYMGFLSGLPFTIVCLALSLCSLTTSIVLYASWRKHSLKRKKRVPPAEYYEEETEE